MVEKCDFSKVISLNQIFYEYILFVTVFYPHLTVSFGDEIEAISVLTLLYYIIFRHVEENIYIVDQEINDILIFLEFENGILFN